MSGEKQNILFEGIETVKSAVVNALSGYTNEDDEFHGNEIFKKYLPEQLCEILQAWFSDGCIDETRQETFRTCARFLLDTTKTSQHAKKWMTEQDQLIDLTQKCLDEIASYGYYIGIGSAEDPGLESFDWLIQAFENVHCRKLLDALFKCVTSRFYVDALLHLSNDKTTTLNTTYQFLLVTCPKYILSCDSDRSYSSKITNKMLLKYGEVLEKFLPQSKTWTGLVMSSLFYPMRFVLPNIKSLTYQQRKPMYNIILNVLLNRSIEDKSMASDEAHVKLIHMSLCLLIEILRSDDILLRQLKSTTEDKANLVKILNQLSKDEKNQNIELKALELASLLISEEEFSKENNSERVTGLFIKNFNTAIQDKKSQKASKVLEGLKDLVQNDGVKEEIVKQNALPSIMQYAKDTKDDPLPLEIVYAMTFNNEGKKIICEDKEFVDHVRELRNSEKKGVSRIADGIMWKVEGEEKFKQKEQDKKKRKEEKSDNSNNASGDKSNEVSSDDGKISYDMMISYCWAQKPICHKINDRLEKDGYKVWLDRDEMRGSIVESMAEAIEESKFVLICMSDNYKKSVNCKAEAEYAFNRKSKIIPLIVEPGYKADGWLGFLAGSKIYVDFADKEGEDFDNAYNTLIEELKRNGLNDDVAKDTQKTDNAAKATASKPEESKKEPEEPLIETTEYLNLSSVKEWNETHVKEFLANNQLDDFMPVCQSMDGEALIEFYNICESKPEVMYGLINNPKNEHPVSLGMYFKFLAKLKKHLPTKPSPKLHFQYRYVRPSLNTEETKTTQNN